jgi:hypothetical protein
LPSTDAVAAIFKMAFEYMSPIKDDSWCQSTLDFWMMQRESIQRYWYPRARVTSTASWNVFDRLSKGIDFWNSLMLLSNNEMTGFLP